MGGPSYETPYPVSDQRGGKVIWNWGTKEWTPYTGPKPGATAPTPPASPEAAGGRDAAPSAASDTMSGGDKAPSGGREGPTIDSGKGAGSTGGVASSLQRRGTARRVGRRPGGAVSLPGQSLLAEY